MCYTETQVNIQTMANPKYLIKIARWKRVKQTAFFILSLSLLLGLIYPAIADGFGSIYPFLNGIVIGVVGGILISLMELYIFSGTHKKVSFIFVVIAKSLIYSFVFALLVIGVIFVSRKIQFNYNSFSEAFYSVEFQHFLYSEDLSSILLYALAFTSLILFIKEISKKLGRAALMNFITGRYYRPVMEDRIFLFLDINDSTTIAERLNGMENHLFVNEFFKDITESILTTSGEVHQYVGDEVVITWNMKKGLKDNNCLYTYFYAKQSIGKVSKKYEDKYGFCPSFKASLHCGHVIRGEIGEIKSEIIFSGDVMNTTSRIESLCGSLKEPLLVSQQLMKKFPSKVKDNFVSKGFFKLKGKENELQVFALKDNTADFLI